MNPRTSLLSLLLIATVSVSAQTLPARPTGALSGPFNLSQPAKAAAEQAAVIEMEKLPGQSAVLADLPEVGLRNEEAGRTRRLRYGAGFENRQQGMAGGGGGGRGGRGGRGRGR